MASLVAVKRDLVASQHVSNVAGGVLRQCRSQIIFIKDSSTELNILYHYCKIHYFLRKRVYNFSEICNTRDSHENRKPGVIVSLLKVYRVKSKYVHYRGIQSI